VTAGSHRVILIGHPLGHSVSPAFQNAAFAASGIDARYALADVLPDELERIVASLRADSLLGANVTVPYKRAVIPFLDALSDEARALGAVNTIVNHAGRLTGLNTDVPGFAADLRAQDVAAQGRVVVLLGAGGAARAVAAALAAMGVGHLAIANRSIARAREITDQYPTVCTAYTLDSDALHDVLPGAALLVNATSVGLHGDATPLDDASLALLPPAAVVYDLIYRPTALLRHAGERGYRTIDGLGMLVHQGALAWEAWTNQSAPIDVMWAAARAARDGA